MMSDAEARDVLRAAFAARAISDPSRAELQAVQAIGRFEGVYGAWPKGGAPSWNWGAIQAGAPPCDPSSAFEHGDSHADGEKYRACFRRYPDPVTGAADLVRELYRRPGVPDALVAGDATAIARAMHDSHYFEASPDAYARAIETHAESVAEGVGEPWVVRRGGGAVSPPRTTARTEIYVVPIVLLGAAAVLLRRSM